MTLIEIENLSAEDLKGRYKELVGAAQFSDTRELAERFVSARMDAKNRDVLLQRQGETITALQQGATSSEAIRKQLEEALAAAQEDLKILDEKLTTNKAGHLDVVNDLKGAITVLEDRIVAANARADRLKVQASRHSKALNSASQILLSALGEQLVDAADKGE